jgi:hypothetical protein
VFVRLCSFEGKTRKGGVLLPGGCGFFLIAGIRTPHSAVKDLVASVLRIGKINGSI